MQHEFSVTHLSGEEIARLVGKLKELWLAEAEKAYAGDHLGFQFALEVVETYTNGLLEMIEQPGSFYNQPEGHFDQWLSGSTFSIDTLMGEDEDPGTFFRTLHWSGQVNIGRGLFLANVAGRM